MRISQRGVNLIKKFEGFRAKPYLCSAGVATIGYGSTYYENGVRVKLTDPPIDRIWAEQLLRNVLVHYEREVDAVTTDLITQNQFDALTSFTYNVGITNFRKSTLLQLINSNYRDPKIRTQFLRWDKAGGRVIEGLKKRREIEANLYFT